MPTINGYHHRESCTWKFFTAVQWEARDWYQKRLAVEARETEIADYIDHGLTEDDVSGWIRFETMITSQNTVSSEPIRVGSLVRG